jgi:DnaD/phage-associated family protein
MAWFEFHQSLVTHRKLYSLAARLGVGRAQAAGHLAFLWAWALDNAASGDLAGIGDGVIGIAADWPKKAEVFVRACIESGFIDDDENGRRLHDWDDYAGRLNDRRARNKDRMKCARAGHSPCTCGARVQHVQSTERARVQLPNQHHHQTPTPDQAPPPPPPPPPEAAAVFRALEDLTGSLTNSVADAVNSELDDGREPAWIVAACEEAAKSNRRSWSYVAGILKRWDKDGFQAPWKEQRNGQTRDDPRFPAADGWQA